MPQDGAGPPRPEHWFVRPADGRYYWIGAPVRDLLGDLVVECWNGSLHSRRGRQRLHAVADEAAAQKLVAAIGKLRRRHGYQPLESPANRTDT